MRIITRLRQKNRRLQRELETYRQSEPTDQVSRALISSRLHRQDEAFEDSVHQILSNPKQKFLDAKHPSIEQPFHWDTRFERQASLLDLTHDSVIIADLKGMISYWSHGAEVTYEYTRSEATGRNLPDLLKTDYPTSLQSIFNELHEWGYWYGELIHHTKHGEKLNVSSRWVLRKDSDGTPQDVLIIERDISSIKQAERIQQHERNRLIEVLDMIPGYVAIIGSDKRIRFANDGFLEAFGEPGNRPCHEIMRDAATPCRGCPGEPIHLSGQRTDWECTFTNGRTFHVYAFPFADVDGSPAMLEIGIEITRQKLMERQLAESSERERRIIGRELHDSLGQKLTGLGFLIKGLVHGVADLPPSRQVLLDQIQDLINESVRDIRVMARGLDPVGLELEGLVGSLHQLAENLSERYPVSCALNCPDEIEIDDPVALHLFRIAQEAAGNAARHSGASQIGIELLHEDSQILLRVWDNGNGIPAAALQRKGDGMGMHTMHFRANAIQGRLLITQRSEGGTEVFCQVPTGISAVQKETP